MIVYSLILHPAEPRQPGAIGAFQLSNSDTSERSLESGAEATLARVAAAPTTIVHREHAHAA
jgi:hypothetical protein